MIWGHDWLITILFALIIDIFIGELPGKHLVQYMGDFIRWFEKIAYKNSLFRGALLMVSLLIIVLILSIILQLLIFQIFEIYGIPGYISAIVTGIIASTGLASKSLKDHVLAVLNAPEEKKRELLSVLVTRNTDKLSDKKVYSSLIESHSENLSDGFIAPLYYLMLFGLPGIMAYKAIQTLDSMVGFKNDKYLYFGRVSAYFDDVLNFIPARLTAFLIWLFAKEKPYWKKIFKDAKIYSSSPNAGYPVATAAYCLGIKLGGAVFYGNKLIEKSEVGIDENPCSVKASQDFISLHTLIELTTLAIVVIVTIINYIYFK